ncbi:MAG TPA: hypothetical protein VE093_18560 [Polyangiaceae bacterium]|nr:hypothetical protein [Polyangiaceae bacterium]
MNDPSEAEAAPSPESPKEEREAEEPRRSIGRSILDFFRAGMLGSSLTTALLWMFVLLDKERIFDFDRNLGIGIGTTVVASIALAITRGFPARARGAKRIAGRALGVTLTGGLLFGGQLFLLIALAEGFGLNEREIATIALPGGLALLAVTWLRVRTARQKLSRPEPAPVVVERRAGPYFWAGGLAAGMMIWLVATLIAFETSDLLSFRLDNVGPLFFLLGVACVAFGASRGFSAELRRGLSFGSRFFLTLICSLFAGLGLFLVILPLGMIFEPGKLGTALLITVLAVALMGAALVRGRMIAAEGRRGRVEVGALAAAVALLTLWPQSAWMRYALGSAEGARALAEEHFERQDYARAATFAAAACDRDDAEACVMAAHVHQAGLGVPSNLQQAKRLVARSCRSQEACSELADNLMREQGRELVLARACELGDRRACLRRERRALGSQCYAGDAFACRALAETFQNTPDYADQRSTFYGRACALGDQSACPAKPAQ